MKHIFLIAAILFCGCKDSNTTEIPSNSAISIPFAGNSYITSSSSNGDIVGDDGIEHWSSENTVISSFFKISHAGELKLYMTAYADKPATVDITAAGKKFQVKIPVKESTFTIGTISADTGYLRVDFTGIKREGSIFAHISNLQIEGAAATPPLVYVHDYETYWSRRGPSVHLKYELPQDDIEYFYNEVTVPTGNDVIGSYFMANGFGEGYFGMQVNSETERRILFSVWSPFDTQNPEDIPEDQRIKVLKQGKDVHIGEFGDEGSGGQSYLVYPWKAGNAYRFLTHIKPDGKGNTIYTSYFCEPEKEEWQLIASFMRPKTDTWYTNAHSFLENFIPEQGYITRKVFFGNQWARTTKGKWEKITKSQFTYDATAQAGVRADYQGGTEGDLFYLQNCGFFNESTQYKTIFSIKNEKVEPDIKLDILP